MGLQLKGLINLNITDIKLANNYTKDGVIYLISSIIQNFFPFLLLPFLINLLSAQDYGAYSLILTFSILIATFFNFGMNTSLGRFYFDNQEKLYKINLISSSFNFSLAFGIILTTFTWLFSDKLSFLIFGNLNYNYEITLCVFSSFLFILLNLFTTSLRFDFKAKLFLFISVVTSVLNFIISFYLLQNNFGIISPIYGLLFSSLFGLLISIYLYKDYLRLILNQPILKNLLSFGFPAAINGILFYLIDWSDKFVVNFLVGTENAGIYSFGYKIGALMNICLIMPVHLLWAPYRMKNAKSKKLSSITSKAIYYYFLAGLFFTISFMLIGDDFLKLIFTNREFAFSYDIFPIVMVGLLIFGLQGFVDFGIYYYKKLHFYVICGILGLILNISLNFWFIPIFGILGAAYSTVLTYIFTTSFFYIVSNKYFKIKLQKKILLSILLFISISLISFNIQLIIESYFYNFCLLAIYLILNFVFLIGAKEKKYILQFFKT